jgi:urea transport system permease protein
MLIMSLKLASPNSLQSSQTPVPDFMLWNSEPSAVAKLCCINRASSLWIPFQHEWFGLTRRVVPVAEVNANQRWLLRAD